MVAPTSVALNNVQYTAVSEEAKAKIFTDDAVAFIATLHRIFDSRRVELLKDRELLQRLIDDGNFPNFLESTKHIREDPTWRGPSPGPGLEDRRVEITGPPVRKMVINALNSNVFAFMADFEDSSTPTWSNMVEGQVNLYDAVRENISLKTEKKEYKLQSDRSHCQKKTYPTLINRPRGWHLVEKNFTVDGNPISGALFDFGLYFFHNAKELIKRGSGPYFYLPKTESYLESRLWNDIFNLAQNWLSIPVGTIRATVLIETIHAAFQMEEIIYELRAHCAGLNCGRWDYIFSFAKTFRNHPEFMLPDRDDVTMKAPFMTAYVKLLIQTCHKRGVHAMGGIAAQLPINTDPIADEKAKLKVIADKEREASAGHDGTWVAHPALAICALEPFNKYMPGPNQIYRRNESTLITASNLLNPYIPTSGITEAGIRKNIEIAIIYMVNWLRGSGAVAIFNSMEDAATAEVSRLQLITWVKHGAKTRNGDLITQDLVYKILDEVIVMHDCKEANVVSGILKAEIEGKKFSNFVTLDLYDAL